MEEDDDDDMGETEEEDGEASNSDTEVGEPGVVACGALYPLQWEGSRATPDTLRVGERGRRGGRVWHVATGRAAVPVRRQLLSE